jgi:hypothetical protein
MWREQNNGTKFVENKTTYRSIFLVRYKAVAALTVIPGGG